MMIDTHCHLDSAEFDNDRNEVIQNAFAERISAIIIPSISPENFLKVLSISHTNKNIFCAIGVHPHNANEYNENVEHTIVNLVNQNRDKIVAIGEIGLDYHYNFAPKEVQIQVFARQLDLARQLGLPAIVHNRKSDEDLLSVMKKNGNPGKVVLHCFSGNKSFLEKSLELGCFVSFTGNITFKNSYLTEVVEIVPEDRFFLETDSPYMTPVPFRGQRNEPKLVSLVAQKVSEIKSLSIDEVINMTTKNAISFFKLVFMLIFMLLLSSFPSFSQSFKNYSSQKKILFQNFSLQNQPAEEDFEVEEANPYDKFIGFGPTLGFNTIVVFENWIDENGEPNERNSAYEGKFCWGANIAFSPVDFMITRLEFVYTLDPHEFWLNNEKFNFTNIYRIISLSGLFIPNPMSRVNFFAGAGFTYMFNSLNLGTNHPTLRHRYGLNGSLGFIFNLPIEKVGLFTFTGEWFLLFDFQKDRQIWETELQRRVDAYYYYSLPRLSLNWYPDFLFIER